MKLNEVERSRDIQGNIFSFILYLIYSHAAIRPESTKTPKKHFLLQENNREKVSCFYIKRNKLVVYLLESGAKVVQPYQQKVLIVISGSVAKQVVDRCYK